MKPEFKLKIPEHLKVIFIGLEYLIFKEIKHEREVVASLADWVK